MYLGVNSFILENMSLDELGIGLSSSNNEGETKFSTGDASLVFKSTVSSCRTLKVADFNLKIFL